MLEIASHTLLIASIPVATVGLIAGISHHAHTVAELEKELDPALQDALCNLASSPEWARATDEEAWAAIQALGGRRHLLEQARLMFALTIERAKEADADALTMEAHLVNLTAALKRNWKHLLMPQTNAHTCVEIFTDMCAVWEHQTLDG